MAKHSLAREHEEGREQSVEAPGRTASYRLHSHGSSSCERHTTHRDRFHACTNSFGSRLWSGWSGFLCWFHFQKLSKHPPPKGLRELSYLIGYDKTCPRRPSIGMTPFPVHFRKSPRVTTGVRETNT